MNTPTVTVTRPWSAADPACVAEAETASGWYCHIDWSGRNFNALVTGPHPEPGIKLHAWESMERVYETLGTFFAARDLSHVWVALRASLEAEVRS